MGRFKVGDRVRRVTPTDWPEQYGEVGKEYTVLDTGRNGSIVVIEGESAAMASAFELVTPAVAEWKPKVGDRVRLNQPYDGYPEGTEGTVTDIDGPLFYVDGVGGVFLRRIEPITETPAAPVVAEAQPALRIEAGRYYRTRDGRKVGPMEFDSDDDGYPWGGVIEDAAYVWYTKSGSYFPSSRECEEDLIAEWTDEQPAQQPAQPAQPATTTASNDNAAPATPKFKVGDRITGNAPAWGIVTGEITAFDNSHPTQTYMIEDDVSGYTMWLDNDTISAAPAEPTAAPTNVTTNLTINVTNLADLDAVIAKLKKIRKLQRQIAA